MKIEKWAALFFRCDPIHQLRERDARWTELEFVAPRQFDDFTPHRDELRSQLLLVRPFGSIQGVDVAVELAFFRYRLLPHITGRGRGLRLCANRFANSHQQRKYYSCLTEFLRLRHGNSPLFASFLRFPASHFSMLKVKVGFKSTLYFRKKFQRSGR